MAILACSTCGRKFDSETTEAMPFCSERCRLIDLNRWLTEAYGLPIEADADGIDADRAP